MAGRLFEGVMVPLVLSGSVRPGHAIGARVALSFGEGRAPADAALAAAVDSARVRRARRLAPVDTVPGASGADWALAAAFHDILQAANPMFDAPIRRGAAARILDLAIATIDRVPPPASLGQAIARHTWLARVPDVTRTDAEVTWWSGSREFRGVDAPARLQAWPRLRGVSVVRTRHRLLELSPIAVDRARLATAVEALLSKTPLTDLATCTRDAPAFAWHKGTLALLATGATGAGRALATRALSRLVWSDVDAVLGRATRALLAASDRQLVSPAVSLLADRALANGDTATASRTPRPAGAAVTFAQALGAIAATRALAAGEGPWADPQRGILLATLRQDVDSPAGQEARSLL
jgi:hypothetical protein